ncbi:hypothetical protein [Halomonas rhizosphaerae]|uniref:Uncharacterized protein n=1 Tax=Halomonas rhizosphaerae TaxID=3043296 RepID=A0ABT6UXD7_9GAMM|nr:hypothetical protein [Halomonas rhizosphaerae]MDI5890642.1 hypothetical protein [Halomonas rhizosphaerae]
MLQKIAAALGASFSSDLMRQLKGPAPAPTRNGGRHRTVAQDQRRAAKRRATRRAKRLGHR